MNIKEHKLEGVEYKASPNVGGVKKGYKNFVVHFDASPNTGGLNWMLDKQSKVSAELWIGRDGRVVQLVPFNITAWHAGTSTWEGVSGLNSTSIGVELQNTGSQEYTDIQIENLIEVIKTVVKEYNIKEIVGHEDISPIRKTDPSSTKMNLFDWKKLFDGIGRHTPLLTTTADVNLRISYGTEYNALMIVKKGTEVYEIQRVEDWSKVQLKGSLQCGWINNKYLK